ncbi:MAG TPA: biotin/lipoyl-containing protein [Candidatus Limnocylindrales bacterium]|nr:biotin/lipoyl-containing protein [Candidatus Limnocylindrales bacterium]
MTDELQPTMADVPPNAVPSDVVAESVADAPLEATASLEATAPSDDGDLELLRLIDRLAALLDRSDLTELEVESGGTGLVLRKPSALAPITVANLSASSAATTMTVPSTGEPSAAGREPAGAAKPSVKAPLTGIFYASPAPGSAPYVAVGGEVAVGQVIGLIEAMKLFNEIKSDLAGRVVRVVAESGTLVKARQPLIEVEPL